MKSSNPKKKNNFDKFYTKPEDAKKLINKIFCISYRNSSKSLN